MRRLVTFLACVCGGTVVVTAFFVARSPLLSFSDVQSFFAGVFFAESVTPEGLKEIYRRAGRGEDKVKVLIVPGHDDESWGTEFRGIREADMTVTVGEELMQRLSSDPLFEPTLVRTRGGYTEEFQTYFKEERKNVEAFLLEKKQTMRDLVRSGSVHLVGGVIHNSAPRDTALRLYSINKWANEHGVDIVLHLHFNDYPGRPYHRAGRYNGFSIYVPDSQFSNARASRAIATALFGQFGGFYAESNLPVEDSGIVEDQELIAIGSYNTLDSASVLIEYGYIYEQRFLDNTVREKALKELAFQTYRGLNRFFGKYGELFERYPTTLLPHTWQKPLTQGGGSDPSILSLQAALLFEELYPPEGKDKRDCPITGSFGPCTTLAVQSFQARYGLPTSGTVGELTLQKLNEKYSK